VVVVVVVVVVVFQTNKAARYNVHCISLELFCNCGDISRFSVTSNISLRPHEQGQHIRYAGNVETSINAIDAFKQTLQQPTAFGHTADTCIFICTVTTSHSVKKSVSSELDYRILFPFCVVLYRTFSVAISLLYILSSLYTSGGSRWWCCEGCDCWELLCVLNMLVWLNYYYYYYYILSFWWILLTREKFDSPYVCQI
jgi:hypothetical protein